MMLLNDLLLKVVFFFSFLQYVKTKLGKKVEFIGSRPTAVFLSIKVLLGTFFIFMLNQLFPFISFFFFFGFSILQIVQKRLISILLPVRRIKHL